MRKYIFYEIYLIFSTYYQTCGIFLLINVPKPKIRFKMAIKEIKDFNMKNVFLDIND